MGSMVQHNIVAMNANRNLNVTTASQAKSTEKLSTGYKINRAADDAAGLSISEKMRRQIRGLTQASANAQDGISSVQTAEGALTEVHDMLQRMDQLATKAANGTLSEDDRGNVQDEIDLLLTEIDRVSETTKFNETYLLKGNAAGTKSDIKVAAHDAGIEGKLVDNGSTATFSLEKALENGDSIKIAGKSYTIGNKSAADSLGSYKKAKDNVLVSSQVKAGDTIYRASSGVTYTLANKVQASSFANGSQFKITDNNGTERTYTVSASVAATSAAVQPDSGSYTTAQIKNALLNAINDGFKVEMTKNGTNALDTPIEVVEKLQDDALAKEVSIAKLGANTTVSNFASAAMNGAKLAEGDVVTQSGTAVTLTDEEPVTNSTIEEIVKNLKNGDMIAIAGKDVAGNAVSGVYTISDETDTLSKKYTAADFLDKVGIDNLDEVAFSVDNGNKTAVQLLKANNITNNTTAATQVGTVTALTKVSNGVTVVGDVVTGGSDDVIGVQDAYKMIAEELKKASSIGTDAGKEASVQNNGTGSFTITKGSVEVKDAMKFNLHVGSDADMTNKIDVKIESMGTANLGLKGLNVKDDSGVAATYAIDAIETAIKQVSTQRSALGAVQNRLEHTIKNVDNVVENTTSAESQIRDTDMATEMVTYSKNNILAQAGQSMLAQANQSNQGVLSLLG